MLKSLYVEHGFKHHKKLWEFGEGLTAITGKNEAGKSLILEFIRFALFGSKALRGVASDYKKLVVELVFEVKGVTYHIKRGPSKQTLAADGKIVASGTTALNQKVVDILGYGLLVFDVANACLQGAVEALGTMKPTDRRKMVDDTVGLNVVDDLIAYVKGEASSYRGRVEALQQNLILPTAPEETEPEDSESLLKAVRKAESTLSELNVLRGRLQALPVRPPMDPAPVQPALYTESKLLRPMAVEYELRQKLTAQLDRLPGVPPQSVDELTKMQLAWADLNAWEKLNRIHQSLPETPPLDLPQIEVQRDLLQRFTDWQRQYNLWQQHKSVCPKCDHEFSTAVSDPGEWTEPKPEYREAELRGFESAWAKITSTDPLGPAPSAPSLSPGQIEQALTAHMAQDERASLLKARDVIPEHRASVTRELMEAVDYETRMISYARDVALRAEEDQQREDLKAAIAALDGADDKLIDLRKRYTDRMVYEGALAAYDKAMEAYAAAQGNLEEAEEQLEDYKNAAKALTELKVRIKQYLLPSLSKVASKLLKSMTGGARQLIEIDDAFNITVDGQALATLSGSAKAAANLSVRIGLGQVLTNKTFSVLLADEIDAAMDEDRAGHTASSLRDLTSEISQIILISHKRPEADAYVEL